MEKLKYGGVEVYRFSSDDEDPNSVPYCPRCYKKPGKPRYSKLSETYRSENPFDLQVSAAWVLKCDYCNWEADMKHDEHEE